MLGDLWHLSGNQHLDLALQGVGTIQVGTVTRTKVEMRKSGPSQVETRALALTWPHVCIFLGLLALP
jgi:hypothetical protein